MNNCMEYRGYHAAISFDADDGIFVGSVLGIADSLNFHGENVAELTDAFHNCVDGYLDFCREMGKAPDKEYKGSLNIRLSPEVHRQASIPPASAGPRVNMAATVTMFARPGFTPGMGVSAGSWS